MWSPVHRTPVGTYTIRNRRVLPYLVDITYNEIGDLARSVNHRGIRSQSTADRRKKRATKAATGTKRRETTLPPKYRQTSGKNKSRSSYRPKTSNEAAAAYLTNPQNYSKAATGATGCKQGHQTGGRKTAKSSKEAHRHQMPQTSSPPSS